MGGYCRWRLQPSAGMLVRTALAVFSLCCVALRIGPAGAQQSFDADCRQIGGDARRLECDFWFQTLDKSDVRSVTARIVGGQALQPASFELYPRAGETSAFLILVDTSNRHRELTVRANADDIRKMLLLSMGNAQNRFGIFTFDETFREEVPLGPADRPILRTKLDDLHARGMASPIYRSAIDAIRKLVAYQAKRRALVLFSDGRAEDRNYTLENVITEARQNNVVIYGFGIAERPADTPYLQSLTRLAEATHGLSAQTVATTSRNFPDDALQKPFRQLNNGIKVTVDLAPVDNGQTVEIALATRNNRESP